MWAWNFLIYSTNMSFRVVFVTCLLAVVSANPLENEFEPRIVGGRNARKKEFPHQVSLQFSNDNKHFCGGAILSDIWVVTAAHCITGDRSKIIIKAGKHNITVRENAQQNREVAHIFIHENFKPSRKRNDIAMLKLANSLNFNSYVNKINLPVEGSEPTGTATLSGWGSTSRTAESSFPAILQAVDLELLDARACERVFNEITHSRGKIDPKNVCTAAGNAGLSACRSDSGSPLIQSNKLVGIVSAAFVPCGTARPTIYTKVSSFVDWINDKMQNH